MANFLVQVSSQEIQDIQDFVDTLNQQTQSIVVVEGKRDELALKRIGFSGKVIQFHKFGGLTRFSDHIANYDTVIMLLDGDRKGRYLTGRIINQIQRRTRIDLSHKKKLVEITKGKIRFIEQLVCYESYLV